MCIEACLALLNKNYWQPRLLSVFHVLVRNGGNLWALL
jgi:hypothetical protein